MSSEPVGLTLAKWVADHGGLVIPAYIDRNCEKRPLIKDWQNRGSRDHGQLEEWWTDKPWANVGVVGGVGSWAVWDADGAEAVDGFRSLCQRVSGIVWEQVFYYRTPGRKDADGTGGGLHAMFLWPGWLSDIHKAEIRREGWRGGLEFRGRATWTLLPCKRADGEYEILNAPDGGLCELPRELWDAFISEAEQQVGITSESGDLREVSPERAFAQIWTDGRKQCLAGLIWHELLRADEDDWEAVYDLAHKFAAEQCDPPLSEEIVNRKFEYTAQRMIAIRERNRAEIAKWNSSLGKLFS